MTQTPTGDASSADRAETPRPSPGVWLALAAAERAAQAFGEQQLEALVEGRVRERLSGQDAEARLARSELETTRTISEAAERARDRDDLVAELIEVIAGVKELRSFEDPAILVADGDRLRAVSSVAQSECQLARSDELDIGAGKCLCGICAQLGEIVTSRDSSADPRYVAPSDSKEPRAHVVVPLKAMGRVVGVLHLHHPTGATPEPRLLRYLSIVAERVAIALEMVRLSQEAKELSLRDALTGLANRRLMRVALEENAARARRRKSPFSAIMIGIDSFDEYKEIQAQPACERLVVDVAVLIQRQVREMDLAVRFSEDQFFILLPDTRLEHAERVAERIRAATMETRFLLDEIAPRTQVTLSCGVASHRQGLGETQLVEIAEKAMLEARRQGGNMVTCR